MTPCTCAHTQNQRAAPTPSRCVRVVLLRSYMVRVGPHLRTAARSLIVAVAEFVDNSPMFWRGMRTCVFTHTRVLRTLARQSALVCGHFCAPTCLRTYVHVYTCVHVFFCACACRCTTPPPSDRQLSVFTLSADYTRSIPWCCKTHHLLDITRRTRRFLRQTLHCGHTPCAGRVQHGLTDIYV